LDGEAATDTVVEFELEVEERITDILASVLFFKTDEEPQSSPFHESDK
jgi:hypothetical protein